MLGIPAKNVLAELFIWKYTSEEVCKDNTSENEKNVTHYQDSIKMRIYRFLMSENKNKWTLHVKTSQLSPVCSFLCSTSFSTSATWQPHKLRVGQQNSLLLILKLLILCSLYQIEFEVVY